MMEDRCLFRGRIWKEQDWVVGYIFEPDAPDYDDNFGTWIVSEDCFGVETFLKGQLASCKVYATRIQKPTIGQCTGLKDKNGTLIFEGDILAAGDGRVPSLVYWCDKDNAWYVKNIRRNEKHPLDKHFARFIGEIIGNIHDNPELLEG